MMEIDGEEWLFYKALPINVALIRGTTADPSGNVTMEREALVLDAQAAAMAARNANGLVIAQVERIAQQGRSIRAQVVVPGVLVDCVVLAAAERRTRRPTARPTTPRSPAKMRVPDRPHRRRAAGRAQADRAPLRLRAAAGRRHQPGHRRARSAWPRWPPRSACSTT